MFISKKKYNKIIDEKKEMEAIADKAIKLNGRILAMQELLLNGFALIKVKLDEGAKMPTRAHSTDAGLDIYAREGQVIPARGSIKNAREGLIIPARGSVKIDTGVHIELPEGTVGFLKSKSGLNVNHGITSEGVIDVGYTGSIVVKLYNNSDEYYEVKPGDKISQLVILPILTPTPYLVDSLEESERGDNGFGSSGR